MQNISLDTELNESIYEDELKPTTLNSNKRLKKFKADSEKEQRITLSYFNSENLLKRSVLIQYKSQP